MAAGTFNAWVTSSQTICSTASKSNCALRREATRASASACAALARAWASARLCAVMSMTTALKLCAPSMIIRCNERSVTKRVSSAARSVISPLLLPLSACCKICSVLTRSSGATKRSNGSPRTWASGSLSISAKRRLQYNSVPSALNVSAPSFMSSTRAR